MANTQTVHLNASLRCSLVCLVMCTAPATPADSMWFAMVTSFDQMSYCHLPAWHDVRFDGVKVKVKNVRLTEQHQNCRVAVSGLLPFVADDPREDEAGVHTDPHVHVDVMLPPHILRRRGRRGLSSRLGAVHK